MTTLLCVAVGACAMTRAEPWSVPARKTRTAPPGAGAKVCREAALGSASKASHLGCHGTRYVRYGRGWYAYPVRTGTRGPGGKPPCASGTYPTREAGMRSLYVPNGGPGAYASAQDAAAVQAAQVDAAVAPGAVVLDPVARAALLAPLLETGKHRLVVIPAALLQPVGKACRSAGRTANK